MSSAPGRPKHAIQAVEHRRAGTNGRTTGEKLTSWKRLSNQGYPRAAQPGRASPVFGTELGWGCPDAGTVLTPSMVSGRVLAAALLPVVMRWWANVAQLARLGLKGPGLHCPLPLGSRNHVMGILLSSEETVKGWVS